MNEYEFLKISLHRLLLSVLIFLEFLCNLLLFLHFFLLLFVVSLLLLLLVVLLLTVNCIVILLHFLLFELLVIRFILFLGYKNSLFKFIGIFRNRWRCIWWWRFYLFTVFAYKCIVHQIFSIHPTSFVSHLHRQSKL